VKTTAKKTSKPRIVPPPTRPKRAGAKPSSAHEQLLEQLELQNKQLRQAQLELEHSRDRYANLYDFAPVGYVTFDAKGVIKEINLTGAMMLGVDRAWVINLPLINFVEPADRRAFQNHLLQCKRGNTDVTTELQIRTSRGQTGQTQWRSVCERDAETHTPHWRTVITDITTLKQAERVLRRAYEEIELRVQQRTAELEQANTLLRDSESKFRSLVEQSTDGIVIVDRDGSIVEWNHAQEKISGLSHEHVVGQPYWDVWTEFTPVETRHPVTSNQVKALIQATLKTGELHDALPEINDYNLPNPDGTCRYIQTIVFPIKTERGNLLGAISRDITDHKRVEEKLTYLSTHDGLTGLYNRAFFSEELQRLAHSRHFPVSIVVADVNGLKGTNDRLGHAAGDLLIQETARLIKSAFRSEDLVARIGGDEFAVILMETNPQQAEELLARVRAGLREHNSQPARLPFSFSIGVATAEHGKDLEATLKHADAAMYRDKQAHYQIGIE
jgi:diguanylate cyclase (GGDEF)-like protein/PAS domain S-box-containing protein